MKTFDEKLIANFLKYGFDPEERIDIFSSPIFWNIETIKDVTKKHFVDLLKNRFWETVQTLNNLSSSTWKQIVLALSGWIDSLLIFKLLDKYNIKFTPVNISYSEWFNEIHNVKKYLWDSHVEFKEYDIYNSLNNLNKIDFQYIVAHPTLLSYYNLISSVKDNSILVTWDLADEIFWFEPKSISDEIIFSQNELKKILSIEPYSESIDKQITWINEQDKDIRLWYNNITYKMIKNCLIGKNVEYFPFFANFYDLFPRINKFWLRNEWKDFLKWYMSELFWINYNEKKVWFKFPALENVLKEYYDYIIRNNNVDWLKINIEYLDNVIMNQDIKVKRWKLFVIVVLLHLLHSNDPRLFLN